MTDFGITYTASQNATKRQTNKSTVILFIFKTPFLIVLPLILSPQFVAAVSLIRRSLN